MQAEPSTEERGGRSAERFRTPESYVHWDRGLAIVAGMIGIVLLFVLLMTVLPIRGASDGRQLTGQAAAPAPAPPPPAPAGPTPPAGAAGPNQPSVAATSRQFPFVRRGPGINFAVIMNLTQGQRVDVVGRSPDRLWLQIIRPDNASERGWVSADLLQVDGDLNTVPEVRE